MARVLTASRSGILLSGVRAIAPSNFAVPNGLVGYWGFDPDCIDITNKFAFDLIGGNTGTLSTQAGGALPTAVGGQVGQALSFTGITGGGGFVTMGNVLDAITATISFSAAVWTNYTSQTTPNNYPGIFQKLNGTTGVGWGINVALSTSLNKPYWSLNDGTNNPTLFGPVFGDSFWHHICGICDRTSNLMHLYTDGVWQGSTSISTLGSISNTGALTIGVRADTTNFSNCLNGFIDEVRLYNRPLSAHEVGDLYVAGLFGHRDSLIEISQTMMPVTFMPPPVFILMPQIVT